MSRWKVPSRSLKRWKLQVIERDGMQCAWCSKETWRVERPKGAPKRLRFTLDHVIPRNGTSGLNTLDNFIGACYQCNHTRGNLSVEEFLPLALDPRMDIIEAAIRRTNG
jgi:5-methylcytosine-specific restriction endonuclease McrA